MNYRYRLLAHLRRLGLAYVVLFISLALSFGAYFQLRNFFARRQEIRFIQASELIFQETETQLAIWLKILQGVRGLFHYSISSPAEITAYLDSIGMRKMVEDSPMQDLGIGWRITPDIETRHMQYLREHGYPKYQPIWASNHVEHFPIVHLETARGREEAGWDLLRDPIRAATIFAARDNGGPILTPPTSILMPEGDLGPKGVVLYLPIYRGGTVPEAVEERRQNLRGFVFASFNLKNFFQVVADARGGVVNFEVYDTQATPENLLYESDRSAQPAGVLPRVSTRWLSGDLFGRTWKFGFTPLPALALPLEKELPAAVLIAGFGISLLFFGLVQVQARGRRTAELLSKGLQTSEAALRQSNATLAATLAASQGAEQRVARTLSLQRAAFEATFDGLLVVDREFRIVSYNQQFVRMWKLEPSALESMDDRTAILTVVDQLVDPEQFLSQVRELYSQPAAESYDLLWFKDGRCFERHSRPQRLGEEIIGRVWSFRDITERQRNQQAIEKREKQYRDLVQTSHDLIWSVDAEGHWTFVNNAAKRIYGYTPEELIGRPFMELVTPEQLVKDLAVFAEIKAGKPAFRYVTEHIRKDGRPVLLSYNAIVLKDADGTVMGTTGTARDITEQVTAEQRLRDSEALYCSLVENIPFCIFRKNLVGRYTFGNSAFCAWVGLSLSELVGKTVHDCFAPELARKYEADDRNLVQSGGAIDEIFLLHEAGRADRYVHVIKSALRNATGDVVGIQGIFWDVTSRHLAEHRLAEEKERLAVTLRSIGDGVVATDNAGLIVLMNPVAESISSTRTESALGREIWEVFTLLHPDSKVPVSNLRDFIFQGRPNSSERHLLKRPEDVERIIEFHGSLLRDAGGQRQGAVFVFKDITEGLRLEQELQKSSKLESVGLLAGGIAHDFNNILTAIVGNLSLLRFAHTLPQDVGAGLLEAEKAALRAKELTYQLLTFAKGGAPIKEATSIAAILRDSAQFMLHGSNITPLYEIADDLAPAEVDPAQMSQVIHNLVLNAKQAMPDGGSITLSARNHTQSSQGDLPLAPGKYVHVAVRDHGRGIAPDNLGKIFDPYFTTKEDGNGLGLATAYSIIKRHDGLITVESELNQGTIFHIYLPASNRPAIPASRDESAPRTGTGRLLAMDDEPAIRHLLNAILKRAGYEITTVPDGAALVAEYQDALNRSQPYQVVIMDLTVPGGMGGREAIVQLRSLDPNVRAIVSSGYSTDPVMSNFRAAGFCGMVEKPYKVETLIRAIERALSADA